ncbi:MAG TPA: hypothetical protein VGC57_13080 [Cellulomonas sp.]
MTLTRPDVQPTGIAREQLSTALKRFRAEGVSSQPLVFGSHRKPEGVVIPFELYEAVYPAIEDAQIAPLLQERLDDERPRVSLEDALADLGLDASELEL